MVLPQSIESEVEPFSGKHGLVIVGQLWSEGLSVHGGATIGRDGIVFVWQREKDMNLYYSFDEGMAELFSHLELSELTPLTKKSWPEFFEIIQSFGEFDSNGKLLGNDAPRKNDFLADIKRELELQPLRKNKKVMKF